MKSVLAFLASTLIWYGIISFITFNPHVETWHWTARLSLGFFSFLTFSKVDKNI